MGQISPWPCFPGAASAIYPWTGRPGQPNPPDWDDIPGAHGSTPELERFRHLAPGFAALGVRIFGLSLQETGYQQQLFQRLGLPFPILSDADSLFAGALALPSFATGGVIYLKRLTVADPATHADEVLSWCRAER